MSIIKKTISIDEKIAQEASNLNSNFSAVVEEALIEYIHHYRVQKAINSFGKWGERENESANFIADLRSKDNREQTTHHTIESKKIKPLGHNH